jgi:hypothetical protein
MRIMRHARPMDAYTYQLIVEKYNLLICSYRHLNGFSRLEEFLAEFEGRKVSPGPDDEPYEYRVSRMDADLPFQPGNVVFSQIETHHDLAALIAPAI